MLGNDHPNTLRTILSIAAMYVNQNKCSDAEPLYAKCVAGFRRVLGDGHPTSKQCVEMYKEMHNNLF